MEFFKNLKLAWYFAKDQKWKIFKYLFCGILSIIISVIVPIFGARMTIYLTSNMLLQLLIVAIIMFFVECSRNVVNYFIRYYSQVIYRETFSKIQTELGSTILRLQNSAIDANGSGVFIQRLTNDTSRIADIFNVLNMHLRNIVTDLGIFGALFVINKWVFLYILVMVIFIYIVESTRVKKYMEKDAEFRKKNESVTGFVGEIVRGVRDIKMLNAETSFIKSLETKIIDLNEHRYGMQKTDRNFGLVGNTTRDLFDLLLVILCIYLMYYGKLEMASALVINNYSGRVTSLANYFGMLLDSVKDFNLSSSRIFAIMSGEDFPKEEFGTEHIDKVNGDFEFKNVKFSYGTEKVLKGVNFKIHANETVAFVGKSGAGKTTIFNLLCKMYEPDSGLITIDGIDIKKLDRESIRGNITIISQNPYIFNLSIRENLKLVKENLTEGEMKEACEVACLSEFIESLPDKYDTVIGEGGVNLSGGQKQRLAIARALVQKTEIILFDEATSALDNETQAKIQEAIENMKNEYTILIIAHRLSTIINCDRIVFLNDGKIEMEGTHKELLKKSKSYKHLYESEIRK
ncbi:MAG: ABC transporter ATP-binding protein/permease [Malacoplasma sp.]|nr:ABC transporter ATP-binding protein/permease [Malacoplasma sp.]